MPLAVERAQLGLLLLEHGLLLAQVQDHRGVGDFAHQLQRRLGAAHVADHPQPRLRRRQVRARRDQLVVEVGQLLVVERGAGGLDDVVLGLELGHRLVRLLHLGLELAQPLLEPARRLVARGQLARHLVVDEAARQPVGDHRRLVRVGRGEGDRDQVGFAVVGEGGLPEEVADRPVAGQARGVALEHRRRLARQPGGDQPLVGQLRHQLLQRRQERRQRGGRRVVVRDLQRRVELRVVEQVEVGHHRGDEVVGLEQAHLGGHGRRGHRHPRQHLLDVGHLQLARVEHHRGVGGVDRRLQLAQHRRQRRADRDHQQNQPFAPPQHAHDVQQVDRLLVPESVVPRSLNRPWIGVLCPHRVRPVSLQWYRSRDRHPAGEAVKDERNASVPAHYPITLFRTSHPTRQCAFASQHTQGHRCGWPPAQSNA